MKPIVFTREQIQALLSGDGEFWVQEEWKGPNSMETTYSADYPLEYLGRFSNLQDMQPAETMPPWRSRFQIKVVPVDVDAWNQKLLDALSSFWTKAK